MYPDGDLYKMKKQYEYIQFYLFLMIKYFDILWPQGSLKVLTVTSGGFTYKFCLIICILFVFLCATVMMVTKGIETWSSVIIYDKIIRVLLMWFVALLHINILRSSLYFQVLNMLYLLQVPLPKFCVHFSSPCTPNNTDVYV